jgi:alpha-glucosidase
LTPMHYHDWEPFCVEPLAPELGKPVTLRLRTKATAGFLFFDRHGEVERRPLERVDGGLAITLPLYSSPLRYCFALTDRRRTLYVGATGTSPVLPRYDQFFHLLAQPVPPDWSVGAVFYQIFPDRFRNGNPANDPQPGQWVYMNQPIEVNRWDQTIDPQKGPLQHYGGDLEGITQSLDYLAELGVEALYLCPIFPSPSNHRYDTAGYLSIDPQLGGQAAFEELVQQAHARGIRLILDGVFNHTGDRHPDFQTALADPGSPEAEMFTFHANGSYAAFFDVKTLPKVDYSSPLAIERFISGPRSPVRHWIQQGIDGWRLDVAHQIGEHGTDRHNHELLRLIHRTAREENPDALVFGEIFFDSAPTLRAHTLDGSMQYAGFANPVMDWLSGRNVVGWPSQLSARQLWEVLWSHYASLPLSLRHSMYTLIGSHDIPRPLWRLRGRVDHLKLALGILLTFPGSPAIYYGDEIGLDQTNPYHQHYGDPMCRGPFPWNQEVWNLEVRNWVKQLIALRKQQPCLRRGGLAPLKAPRGVLAYQRCYNQEEVWVLANPGQAIDLDLPPMYDLLGQQPVQGSFGLEGLAVLKKGSRD